MLANNFYRALGQLFTDVLFVPYQYFREISFESWWMSNAVNIVFIGTGMLLFLYWLGQLQKFRRAGTE